MGKRGTITDRDRAKNATRSTDLKATCVDPPAQKTGTVNRQRRLNAPISPSARKFLIIAPLCHWYSETAKGDRQRLGGKYPDG